MTDFKGLIFEGLDDESLSLLFGSAYKQDVNKDHISILEVGERSTPSGVSPEIASVEALSSTSIKVNFAYPATDNAALRSTASYLISPSLEISAVEPEEAATPSYVVLTIEEQKDSESYSITLQRIVRA